MSMGKTKKKKIFFFSIFAIDKFGYPPKGGWGARSTPQMGGLAKKIKKIIFFLLILVREFVKTKNRKKQKKFFLFFLLTRDTVADIIRTRKQMLLAKETFF